MKKIVTVLGSVVFLLLISFGFGIGSGCACFTREEIAEYNDKDARVKIEQEKMKNGRYPAYEELKVILPQANKYDEKWISKGGIYYAPSEDGKDYTLKTYTGIYFFTLELPLFRSV